MAGWSVIALLVVALCRSSAVGTSVPVPGCSSPSDRYRSRFSPAGPPGPPCPPAPFADCKELPGDEAAPYPACCPKYRCPGRCFSDELQRWFKAGDSLTLPECRQARCLDTDSVGVLPCGLFRARPGCRAVRVNPDAEYPACCHQEVCDEPPPEVRCYDKELDRHFSVGEKWTLPGCGGQATCRPGGAVSAVGCALQATDTPGCGLDDGDASLEYPQCCPKITCQACHSPRLDRYFGPGDTWTDNSCRVNQCSAGPYGATVTLQKSCDELGQPPYSDCEVIATDLGRGDFPQCCPRLRCPGRCQDHGQWHRVGEQWEDADGCSRAICVDTGRVERLTCSPPAEDDWFRPGCRLVDGASNAPFPACCGKLTCYPGPPADLECRDAAGASRKVGDTWTEAGCVRSSCEMAEGGVAVVRHGAGCRPPPSWECQLETDDHDHDQHDHDHDHHGHDHHGHDHHDHHDHHGHDHHDHHGHDHHGHHGHDHHDHHGHDHEEFPFCCPTYRCSGHCFSAAKDRWFSVGERWTEGCQEAMCTDGGRVVHKACPFVVPAGPGCRVVPGNPNAEYPNCCSAVACEQSPYG